MTVPTRVAEVELSDPWASLPPLQSDVEHVACRVLVRLHGQPLGFVTVPAPGGAVDRAAVERAVDERLGRELAAHLAADGLTGTRDRASDPACRAPGPVPPPGDRVSVVLCTRDRSEMLRAALGSVLLHDDPRLDVVVVDNAPRTSATRDVVDELADPRVRYLLEPRPGLSVARNTGARAALGDVLAFTDDDVVVDREWIPSLLRGFTRVPDVGCVTGLVPSAELDTVAQHFFDAKVQWSSSCVPRVYDLDEHRGEGVLYPYSAGVFGTGANFAVSRAAFERLGGFDEALGAGAPTRGGEDLDWFVRTLLAGFALSYEPSAVVWHKHRRDLEALGEQLYGYGTGLTAYLLTHALTGRGAADISRRVVRGLGLMRRAHRKATDDGIDPALLRRELVGMLHGPGLLLRARRGVRAARR
jgi:GT2 family glycosyltransferase